MTSLGKLLLALGIFGLIFLAGYGFGTLIQMLGAWRGAA
jgi:hypothetical protein